jgi:hypothetical protein
MAFSQPSTPRQGTDEAKNLKTSTDTGRNSSRKSLFSLAKGKERAA